VVVAVAAEVAVSSTTSTLFDVILTVHRR